MRIISNFHDYYDGVRKYGIDPKLVYVRETKELEPKDVPKFLVDLFKQVPCQFDDVRESPFQKGLVCFCGRAYPFVNCRGFYCYSIDDFVAAWKKPFGLYDADARTRTNVIKLILSPQPPTTPGRHYKHKRHPWQPTSICSATWNALLHLDLSVPDEMHRQLEAPVFMLMHVGGQFQMIVNPRLNVYEFYKQVPPVDAYQRLSMYVGNNMVTQRDPNIGITDVMRRDTAGFNDWSFKRHRDDPKPVRVKKRAR